MFIKGTIHAFYHYLSNVGNSSPAGTGYGISREVAGETEKRLQRLEVKSRQAQSLYGQQMSNVAAVYGGYATYAYERGHCQCDEMCIWYYDCCSDYFEACML